MSTDLKHARVIASGERDIALDLDLPSWPEGLDSPNGWTAEREHSLLRRVIDTSGSAPRELAMPLREKILRFPSAPIHGLHRLSQDQVNMGPVERFHSYRLLSHPKRQGRVTRIFLMHNGLNETQKMGLYYQLASYLIDQDSGTVCLLRPFPGHLTRSPYPGLTETPLDHYLWDGLHLFRQFLRYMVETRWLLSAIARYSDYRCISGSSLLAADPDPARSRLQPRRLARVMAAQWNAIYDASKNAIAAQGLGTPTLGAPPRQSAFEHAITALRGALRLDRYPERGSERYARRSEPELHVIGYSLGGFAAQSVFMSWPFLISSCSTVLSGGAMKELAPTAFADPEEWQTVLHSLRYELDDAMMDWRFHRSEPGKVAGIDPDLFLFLKRTFYEVFQQEYRGSFQTRLVAFRQRMLFVVGGNDPIVRPQSVLDSGPPDGINMVAVGGLGHFLEGTPQSVVEQEQRSFWLPEVGSTIGRLAGEAAKKHRADLADTWLDGKSQLPADYAKRARRRRKLERRSEGELSIAERLEVERDGTLPNLLFQRSLDDLLAKAAANESHGLLFILKNEPPTFLLDEQSLQQQASGLYHDDVSIAEYIDEVRGRADLIKPVRERICVVLPWNAGTIMRLIDAGLQHPSQSESSGEQMPEGRDRSVTWENFLTICSEWTGEEDEYADSIRVFDGRAPIAEGPAEPSETESLADAARAHLRIEDRSQPVTAALPDCWMWLSNSFFGLDQAEPAPSLTEARQLLRKKAPEYLGKEHEAAIAERLRKGDVRMLALSRARFNPRFRGRVIAEPRQAQELLLRSALCICESVRLGDFDFKRLRLKVA